jgi:Cu/Ag efflux protein CusF
MNIKSFIGHLVCAVLIAGCVVGAQTVPTRSREHLVSVVARVETINQATREVTLKGSGGNVVSFTVDKRVARLDEVKVGDTVIAEYYESFTAELRAPTEAEKANPLQVLTQTAKAPAGTQPAAGALRVTKAVVTVEGLDRPTKSLTVSGKAGMVTIEVEDVAALSKLHLGDTIVVTYTEALAVALEKRAPGK